MLIRFVCYLAIFSYCQNENLCFVFPSFITSHSFWREQTRPEDKHNEIEILFQNDDSKRLWWYREMKCVTLFGNSIAAFFRLSLTRKRKWKFASYLTPMYRRTVARCEYLAQVSKVKIVCALFIFFLLSFSALSKSRDGLVSSRITFFIRVESLTQKS